MAVRGMKKEKKKSSEMKKARRVRLRVLRSLRVCVRLRALCVACGFVHEKAAALFLCTPQHPSALNSLSPLPRALN